MAIAYEDRSLKRLDEKVALNDIERSRAKRAAILAGRRYGEFKRELINEGVRKILAAAGEELSAGSYDV